MQTHCRFLWAAKVNSSQSIRIKDFIKAKKFHWCDYHRIRYWSTRRTRMSPFYISIYRVTLVQRCLTLKHTRKQKVPFVSATLFKFMYTQPHWEIHASCITLSSLSALASRCISRMPFVFLIFLFSVARTFRRTAFERGQNDIVNREM